MNLWQVTRQLKYLLLQELWAVAGNEVFSQSGGVIVTAGTDRQAFMDKVSFPAAIIRPLGGDRDPDDPGLINQRFNIRLIVKNRTDAFGESAMIGGSRVGLGLKSQGRGILEIEEKLFDAVGKLTDKNGVRIELSKTGAGDFIRGEEAYFAFRDYTFDGQVTTQKYYHPPTNFTSVESGGTVTCTWDLPGVRYDTRKVMLRRNIGTVSNPGPTDGTDLAVANTATTDADTPGSGTFTYAIFEVYDEFGESADKQFSENGIRKTVVVP